MRVPLVVLAFFGGVTSIAPPANAQQSTTPPSDPSHLIASYQAHMAMQRSSPFRNLDWSFLGPTNLSGRAMSVAVADRGARRRIYVAYHFGGLWKSDDRGNTWQSVATGIASPTLYAVAVAPSDPDVVWIGTAAGVYKSLNAGRTWKHMGLGIPGGDWLLTVHRGLIIIHPTNANIVYVAADAPWDAELTPRGLFKTTDGGKTWKNVLYRDPRTDVSDLVMDPKDPKTLYAATYQLPPDGSAPGQQRTDSNQTSIWKTSDGGGTWVEVSDGLPGRVFRGHIDIGIAPSDPMVLYAVVDNRAPLRPAAPGALDLMGNPDTASIVKGIEIYRTSDQGRVWRNVSSPGIAKGPTWWIHGVHVDPVEENTIYLSGIELNISHDGGRQIHQIVAPHVDHNGFWIDPKHPDVFYDCTDGGIYLFADGGASWTYTPVPTTMFYDIALDQAEPFHVYGSAQDYGSFRTTIDLTGGRGVAGARAFGPERGSEATRHAVEGASLNALYTDPTLQGNIFRYDLVGPPAGKRVTPPTPAGVPALRHTWLLSFVLSTHDEKTVYAGYQFLFRSHDRGDHWEKISLDLTDNDPVRRLRSTWGRQAISVIAESPRKQGLLYVGTDDGHLQVTMDDGATWSDLTKHLPRQDGVTGLVASAFADGTVYVAQTPGGLGFRRGATDVTPFVYKSTDYGKTFVSLAANLPTGPVNVLREDPADPNTLYVGTRLGAYVSTNGGAKWQVLGGNLPVVSVFDLQIHPRDQVIVAATYGRGVWLMDARKVRAHP